MSDTLALDICQHAIDVAKAAGASFADAVFSSGRSTSVKVRLQQTEEVTQSRDQALGLRVLVGQKGALRTATVSTSDLSKDAVARLAEQAVALARRTAEDPFSGPPDADDPGFEAEANAPVDLETWDDAVYNLDPDRAVRMALETEQAALSRDPRLTNSEGAEVGWGFSDTHVVDSRHRHHHTRSTSISLWTTPLAEQNGEKERDYWWTSSRHLGDLLTPDEVGRIAAERTLRRLGAKKPRTTEVPIVYEAPIASRILGTISGAINGGAIFRDASYLIGKLGERIASPLVTVTDNPWIIRGPASRIWDGEGLATRPLSVVEEGILKTWILDTYSGRKLSMPSTRSAWRGLGSPSPGTSNFWMNNGDKSLADLIADIDEGLFVTETFGGGANTITGDYSQGASGIWIEKGQLTYPVHEFTIASTLPTLWQSIEGLANDRHPGRSTSAPSFRVARMTVAGQ
jgi:PmbA protein